MFRKGLFTSATLFGCAVVILAHAASVEAASAKKAAPPAKAASKIAYACEGVVALNITASNGATGRDVTPFGFKAILDLNTKKATVIGVEGSVRVRPGRYEFKVTPSKFTIGIPWTDENFNLHMMELKIDKDGEFYSEVDVPAKVITHAGALGAIIGALGEHTTVATYSGICMKAN